MSTVVDVGEQTVELFTSYEYVIDPLSGDAGVEDVLKEEIVELRAL
jgi:hypothetical protein